MSKKTGIPRETIIVRSPNPGHGKPFSLFAKPGENCSLCGREFPAAEIVKQVIVQDKTRPTQTMQRLTVCHRSDRCVARFGKGE